MIEPARVVSGAGQVKSMLSEITFPTAARARARDGAGAMIVCG